MALTPEEEAEIKQLESLVMKEVDKLPPEQRAKYHKALGVTPGTNKQLQKNLIQTAYAPQLEEAPPSERPPVETGIRLPFIGDVVMPDYKNLDELKDSMAATALGVAQSADFGLADEAMGVMNAIPNVDREGTIVSRYREGRDKQRAAERAIEQDNPEVAAGRGVGALAQMALPAKGAAAAGTDLASAIGRGAATGAATGALGGFGGAEGSFGEQAMSTIEGAGTGALFGTALGGLTGLRANLKADPFNIDMPNSKSYDIEGMTPKGPSKLSSVLRLAKAYKSKNPVAGLEATADLFSSGKPGMGPAPNRQPLQGDFSSWEAKPGDIVPEPFLPYEEIIKGVPDAQTSWTRPAVYVGEYGSMKGPGKPPPVDNAILEKRNALLSEAVQPAFESPVPYPAKMTDLPRPPSNVSPAGESLVPKYTIQDILGTKDLDMRTKNERLPNDFWSQEHGTGDKPLMDMLSGEDTYNLDPNVTTESLMGPPINTYPKIPEWNPSAPEPIKPSAPDIPEWGSDTAQYRKRALNLDELRRDTPISLFDNPPEAVALEGQMAQVRAQAEQYWKSDKFTRDLYNNNFDEYFSQILENPNVFK